MTIMSMSDRTSVVDILFCGRGLRFVMCVGKVICMLFRLVQVMSYSCHAMKVGALMFAPTIEG